jgi:hypothetical protein
MSDVPKTNIMQITPFMHVRNLDDALAFFDILGFQTLHRNGDSYAYVHREKAGMRIMVSEGAKTPADATPCNRPFTYYIDVRDVDAIHAELKPKLDTLAEGDVVGPFNQPYGQRELMILAPDGNVLVFGARIPGA